jgi:hypothetical protein
LMLFTFSQIMLVITVFLMATPSSSTQDIIAASILSFFVCNYTSGDSFKS